MKTLFTKICLGLFVLITLNSCYTLTYSVGNGAQNGVEIKEKNHYFIYGLADGKTSDPTEMAGDAQDYTITVEHTFVDGLISAITFGIYNPTTTVVTK